MAGITKREQINRKIAAGVTKMTPVVIDKLKQAFALDATVEEACFYAEIHKDTYYRWIKKHPELYDEFERLRQRPVLTARQTVVKNLASDSRLALDYLRHKRSSEFAQKQKVEHEGKVQTEDVTPGSSEAVKEVVNRFEEELRRTFIKAHGKDV